MIWPWLWFFSEPSTFWRLLRSSDAADCTRLHAGSFAHAWSAHEFETLIHDRACIGDAAQTGSRIDGFVLSRIGGGDAEILTIVIDAKARRQGRAQKLLAAHLARLASHGAEYLFLEVAEDNVAALALYRRNGFERVGLRKAYYARPDGKRANAIVMRRELR
jgi:ribosomal-protein-alanine N-acetyltransferase